MSRHVVFARSFPWPGIVVMLLAAARAAPAAGQGVALTGGLEWPPNYLPDVWQPVWLEFRNDTDKAIDGSAALPLASAVMKVPLTAPAHSRVRTTVWAYFPWQTLTAAQRRSNQVPPLTTAEWRGPDGGLLARCEILGVATRDSGDDAGELGQRVLLVSQRPEDAGESYELQSLLADLKASSGLPLAMAAVSVARLSRQSAGLRSCKAIVLDNVDADSFDAAQRQALLEYLRGGGTVVLPAPAPAQAPINTSNWLADLMPVRVVGTRVAGEIELAPEGAALKLREPLSITEAVAARDAQVLLASHDYVHVATRSVGLGRVVFTSFPVNALDEHQPLAAALWEQLLGLRQPGLELSRSKLAELRPELISAMIGRKVASWSVAAALAGGYLLVVLAAQALWSGASRPRAFVVSIAAALLTSIVLVGLGMGRRTDQTMQAARVAVLDVAPDGGGWRQEAVAHVGADEPSMALRTTDERAMIRPALANAGSRPTIGQQPFAVDSTPVYPKRIDHVWDAGAPVDPNLRLDARGTFGPDGLSLQIDNGLGRTLEAPLLVWDRRALAMDDCPPTRSTITRVRLSARGDFTNAAALTSDQSKRRGLMVDASLTPANGAVGSPGTADPHPILIGWLRDDGTTSLLQATRAGGTAAAAEHKSMIMVRAPLRIEPPQPGTKISVPGALVGLNTARMPYDRQKGESVPSQEQGQWLVGFSVAPQLGQVRPTHATVDVRVTLPAQTLTIRRGQCGGEGGTPNSKPAGDLVAEWSHAVGNKHATIECAPGDYDAAGRIWLLLEIRGDAAAGTTTGAPWQLKDLMMSIDADAVGSAKPILLDVARDANEDRQRSQQ